jgi:uncharacterized protein (DUF1501 family)
MISRRDFIRSAGFALYGAGMLPSFVCRAAATEKVQPIYGKSRVLVCIFQRGAMDGLAAVTPYNEAYLREARPGLLMTPSTTEGKKALIDLDGTYGLHPGLASLEPFFRENRLAIVHGMGSPNTTRSHFDAQDYMESGTPFSKRTDSGWLNRALDLLKTANNPLTAVSVTPNMPRILHGENPVISFANIRDFAVQQKGARGRDIVAARSLEDLYDQTSSALLKETGGESFETLRVLQDSDIRKYTPANGAVYPSSTLGQALKQIAMLIKLDVGLQIAFTQSEGWDTHINQLAAFNQNAEALSQSIAAFWTDLGAYQDDVTLMTMTEFGRTVRQNGNNGTDHGRASCSFVLGNHVNGGRVHGNLGPLTPETLEDRRDLPVTTDFRQVFSEVAGSHLRIKDTSGLFPDWKGDPIRLMKR